MFEIQSPETWQAQEIGLDIRTNASPKVDGTKCPEE